MDGLIVADARSLYGAGAAFGEGGRAPALELITGEGPGEGRPSIEDAPIAAGRANVLIEDPAFWLVVTIGAVAVLAIYSR